MFNRVRDLLHQLLNIAWSYWKLKFIRNTSVYILFEKREEGEVEPGTFSIETLKKKVDNLRFLSLDIRLTVLTS